MARKLRKWSFESAQDLERDYIVSVLGVGFKFIRPVRWFQFWRWHQTFWEDYTLSRASELVLIRKMADNITNRDKR